MNMRRSPQMSESFTFDVVRCMVDTRTSRSTYRFLGIDIPEQKKMTLKADIKYKSNWQQGALKSMLASS
jgi:hypothetical protein